MNKSILNLTPPRVLLVLPVQAPSATIYIIKPLEVLARQGKVIFNAVLEKDASLSLLRNSDIVLFCRNQDPTYSWILEECISQKIPTVFDLDDNFWEVPLDLHYARGYRSPERIQQLEEYLSKVNLVRVYSEHLLDKVKRFNQNTCLVTPCIDVNLVPVKPLARLDNKIRITYVTGRGKGDYLINLFADDLALVLNKYADRNLEVYWWGEIPDQFLNHPASRLLNIIHDYDKFVRFLAYKGFDIGLAPLTPTEFNLSKTNTKFRDYGAARMAGVYSDVEVYKSCVQNNITGVLVPHQPGAWFDALSRLITDDPFRKEIGEAAYQYIHENYRQEIVELQWLELMDNLLDNKFKPVTSILQQTRSKSVRLSIGCEEPPPANHIGIDRLLRPGVNIIADLNKPMPFVAGCAELIIADLSRDPVEDADESVIEIYRLGQDGAQVCIIADGVTNMKENGDIRKSYFNEFSPNRWSDSVLQAYKHQGLDSQPPVTRNSRAKLDLRCFNMEFFYQSAYLYLREIQKRKLRQEKQGVCDLILYNCIVVKSNTLAEELEDHLAGIQPIEPSWITIRRLSDTNLFLRMTNEDSYHEARSWQTRLEDEARNWQTRLEDEVKNWQTRFEDEVKNWQTRFENKENQRLALEIELNASKQALTESTALVTEKNAELSYQMTMTRILAQDLDSYRNRKLSLLVERFFDRTNIAAQLPESLAPLLDDSLVFLPSLKNYVLQPSINLQKIPFLAYSLEIKRAGLSGIRIAPVYDAHPQSGVIGIELVSHANEIVAQVISPARQIRRDFPVFIEFPAINVPDIRSFELRVFGRDLDVPLRVLEWRKYSLLGIGKILRMPFCGFVFVNA